MSLESVRSYLAPYGKEHQIIEFAVSSATVALAAEALGIDGSRIAKTLSFAAGEGCILLILTESQIEPFHPQGGQSAVQAAVWFEAQDARPRGSVEVHRTCGRRSVSVRGLGNVLGLCRCVAAAFRDGLSRMRIIELRDPLIIAGIVCDRPL